MNGTARQVLRDLRQGVVDRSPALLVMVLRWALVLVWMVYGPVWVVDPDGAARLCRGGLLGHLGVPAW